MQRGELGERSPRGQGATFACRKKMEMGGGEDGEYERSTPPKSGWREKQRVEALQLPEQEREKGEGLNTIRTLKTGERRFANSAVRYLVVLWWEGRRNSQE